MAYASALQEVDQAAPAEYVRASADKPEPEFLFQSLVVSELPSKAARNSATFSASLALHALLIAGVLVLPLFLYDDVPAASERLLRAFFASPPEIALPPPPPPPPAAAAIVRPRTPVVEPVRPAESAAFVAPIEVPDQIVEEKAEFGFDEGVPGGVEGGVPGGVVGGVVGGLPQEGVGSAAAPVVRIGGLIAAPKLVHSVPPRYPDLAQMAHVSGIVILEALVNAKGGVDSVSVLRGQPLLDEAAIEAVKQWRYKPLLLNGVPTRFLLTVMVRFHLTEKGR